MKDDETVAQAETASQAEDTVVERYSVEVRTWSSGGGWQIDYYHQADGTAEEAETIKTLVMQAVKK